MSFPKFLIGPLCLISLAAVSLAKAHAEGGDRSHGGDLIRDVVVEHAKQICDFLEHDKRGQKIVRDHSLNLNDLIYSREGSETTFEGFTVPIVGVRVRSKYQKIYDQHARYYNFGPFVFIDVYDVAAYTGTEKKEPPLRDFNDTQVSLKVVTIDKKTDQIRLEARFQHPTFKSVLSNKKDHLYLGITAKIRGCDGENLPLSSGAGDDDIAKALDRTELTYHTFFKCDFDTISMGLGAQVNGTGDLAVTSLSDPGKALALVTETYKMAYVRYGLPEEKVRGTIRLSVLDGDQFMIESTVPRRDPSWGNAHGWNVATNASVTVSAVPQEGASVTSTEAEQRAQEFISYLNQLREKMVQTYRLDTAQRFPFIKKFWDENRRGFEEAFIAMQRAFPGLSLSQQIGILRVTHRYLEYIHALEIRMKLEENFVRKFLN